MLTKSINFISFCGIANPETFSNTLKDYRLSVLANITFVDHNDYDNHDMDKIVKLAKIYKTENVITTEKDAVKIEELTNSVPLTFWKVEIEPVWNVSNPFDVLFVNKNRWKKII